MASTASHVAEGQWRLCSLSFSVAFIHRSISNASAIFSLYRYFDQTGGPSSSLYQTLKAHQSTDSLPLAPQSSSVIRHLRKTNPPDKADFASRPVTFVPHLAGAVGLSETPPDFGFRCVELSLTRQSAEFSGISSQPRASAFTAGLWTMLNVPWALRGRFS
jgi:hypothetical protein